MKAKPTTNQSGKNSCEVGAESNATMKTNVTAADILNRIAMLPPTPAAPLKGRGNVRVEIDLSCAEELDRIERLRCPHVVVVTKREAVNRFGRLGFVPHMYVSPEMSRVL